MSRWFVASLLVVGLCRSAAAGDGRNALEVDAEALVSPVDPWIGGSLHYEHQFADSALGVTFRGAAAIGEIIVDDEGSFAMVGGLLGLRQHWGGRYHFEAALGPSLMRRAPSTDDYGKPIYGDWRPSFDFDIALGAKLGPVDASVFLGPIGLGIRVGVPFEL